MNSSQTKSQATRMEFLKQFYLFKTFIYKNKNNKQIRNKVYNPHLNYALAWIQLDAVDTRALTPG